MTRALLVVAGLGLLFWVWAEWVAHRAARALDRAFRQAEAMSAHPATDRRWVGSTPVEDRPDWPPP